MTRFSLVRRDRMRTGAGKRSEEHTSELQSLTNLVCRLLLEKKKTQVRNPPIEQSPSPSSPSNSRHQPCCYPYQPGLSSSRRCSTSLSATRESSKPQLPTASA